MSEDTRNEPKLRALEVSLSVSTRESAWPLHKTATMRCSPGVMGTRS